MKGFTSLIWFGVGLVSVALHVILLLLPLSVGLNWSDRAVRSTPLTLNIMEEAGERQVLLSQQEQREWREEGRRRAEALVSMEEEDFREKQKKLETLSVLENVQKTALSDILENEEGASSESSFVESARVERVEQQIKVKEKVTSVQKKKKRKEITVKKQKKEVRMKPFSKSERVFKKVSNKNQDEVYYEAYSLKKRKPIYPRDLKRQGVEGVVKLRNVISSKGKVVECMIYVSSGYKAFDKSAVKAARRWRYKPALNSFGVPLSQAKVETVIYQLPR